MNKLLINYCGVLLLFTSQAVLADAQPRHGQLRQVGGEYEAWYDGLGRWVSPVAFWEHYAAGNGGLTWGRTAEYPEYEKVREHDTILIETAQGPCLMEFFHERWRRANDVRRWDPVFNEIEGCPHVFD